MSDRSQIRSYIAHRSIAHSITTSPHHEIAR